MCLLPANKMARKILYIATAVLVAVIALIVSLAKRPPEVYWR